MVPTAFPQVHHTAYRLLRQATSPCYFE